MFYLIRRNSLRITAAAVLSLLLLLPFFPQPDFAETAASPRRLPVYSVETAQKAVALTFDCAWENTDTDELLAILKEYGVSATFFATGDFCRRYPDDIRRFFSAGHAVENHSDAHPHPTAVSADALRADTDKASETVTALTGVSPRYYRAPYGEYNDAVMAVIEDECGLQVIQWDVDSRDWQGRTAEDMASSVLSSVQNGSILLFHNDTANTPDALRRIIPALQEKGYRFVRLDELVLPKGTPTDHTGRQTPGGEASAGSEISAGRGPEPMKFPQARFAGSC